MSERKPSPFKTLFEADVATLIHAADDVYQIRFKNRAANAYLVRGSKRTIMIDVGLSTNYPSLVACLNHLGITPEMIDMVVLSHEHLDHIGAAYHFHGSAYIAAHRLAANKIMLRDDFSMLRKMFNEPNVPIDIDIWLEEGNLIDLGNFRLNVMYTPGHTSACISLFDQDKGLLFAADTLMPGGVMGGVFGSGSIADYIHPVAGAAEGPQFEDPAVGAWPAVRHAAGRRADRAATLACPARGHRAIVRRARCTLEFRADHAVGARPQQARRLTPGPAKGLVVARRDFALGSARNDRNHGLRDASRCRQRGDETNAG
ncbi:glyoxylase-like metal-dependent hydrolase (beta-lactamase superfamily II) [Bradyrhizobium sp. JR6.1]